MRSCTSFCEPKPIATPTMPAPASSGPMFTPISRQHHHAGDDDDHHQQRGAQQRQQRAQPRRARRLRLARQPGEVPLDRRVRRLPDGEGQQQGHREATRRLDSTPRPSVWRAASRTCPTPKAATAPCAARMTISARAMRISAGGTARGAPGCPDSAAPRRRAASSRDRGRRAARSRASRASDDHRQDAADVTEHPAEAMLAPPPPR